MRIGLVFQLFARSANVQKKRAFMTIAAIAWGSLALLLLLSFGEGLKRQLAVSGEGMGKNLAIVWPGSTSRAFEGLPAGRSIRTRVEDVELLKSQIPELDEVSGEMIRWGMRLEHGRTSINNKVVGAHAQYGEMRNHIAEMGGRFLNQKDVDEQRRVVFLGDEIASDLFHGANPVGETITINDVSFTVIGVMKPKMQMGNYAGPDENNAVIPITTYRTQFSRRVLSNIVIRPKDPKRMDFVIQRMHEVLGGKYKFDPDDERVISVWDTVESSKIRNNIGLGIEVFLGIIGALTLMIGGVGVANIMYAVVKERTREIGVMMATGARKWWVVGPLVLEGFSYTLVGGLAGIFMAVVIITGLSMIPTEGNDALQMLGTPTLSLPIGIGSALILGLVGLLAGLFPALRAASVDPAAVLRDE